MVKSLAVAAAFCASASAFMAPTPLARAPAAQQSGVSFSESTTTERMFSWPSLPSLHWWLPTQPLVDAEGDACVLLGVV